LHLSALRVLAPVLTQDNHRRLLRAATHKTKRQVEVLVADLCPQPDVPSSMRKLPSARSSTTGDPPHNATLDLLPPAPTPTSVPGPERSEQHAKTPDAPAHEGLPEGLLACNHPQTLVAARPANAATIKPLGQERYRVQFTADKELHDQLLQAKELLRHQVPDGDLAAIMGQAIALLIEQTKKRRFGQTRKARTPRKKDREDQLNQKPDSRHIPHEVRRQVLERDGMRCTFVSDSGHQCEATGMLEFHQEDPFARGGPPTFDTIRRRCRAHNALMAERDFGRQFILQSRRGRSTSQESPHTFPDPSPG
jgi:hypothetical protein